MKFERKLSKDGTLVADQVMWKIVEAKISGAGGEIIFHMPEVEVPAHWSQTATNILAQKYFRKAGVPSHAGHEHSEELPLWLNPSKPYKDSRFGSETSAKQVFHRLAGAWTYHGWKMGLFLDRDHPLNGAEHNYAFVEKNAQIFYDELYLILANQLAAPNSPQWFNTGIWWAYGIEGSPNGQWAINYDIKKGMIGVPFETQNTYEYPQPHACFIQPISDDLVNPGGILDLVVREGRLFKQGSGTGTNFSTIRARDELLSGGGKSSGLMSFLEIGDRAAGAIKSGGTTRRAAKMVVVDVDHPEIEDFINWKAREEQKAAAMYIGSYILADPELRKIVDNIKIPVEIDGKQYEKDLIPPSISEGIKNGFDVPVFSIDYEGEAIRTVGGQNANNTVRVSDAFMNLVEMNAEWALVSRTQKGYITKKLPACALWNQITRAAWASADPGLQFHDTINKWHTCTADGEIRASNPCSEYMFLDNTACNLASLNLGKFYNLTNLADPTSQKFDIDLFCHVARLMTAVLDISVTMASFPSKEIALGSYNYRTLGLGYANLGGLLMRMGLPYDSDEGRQIAASITALLSGVSYLTSSEEARELGPFPRWEKNQSSMQQVMEMHESYVEGLEVDYISEKARQVWKAIMEDRPCASFRNAQTTLLAPTGTIALLMDCDTTGVEPDFSLRKTKSLAGGGEMELINLDSVQAGLLKLGYQGHKYNLIAGYIKKHGTVEGCPDISPEHIAVFDCANAPQGFSRAISPMGHLRMVAAVQPFLSGAVSKTINMPNNATIEDVSEAYMQAWKLGLKAVSIYRDGSKLAQPLSTQRREPISAEIPSAGVIEGTRAAFKDISEGKAEFANEVAYKIATQMEEKGLLLKGEFARGVREYLPWRRDQAYVQKVKIGPTGQSVFLTIGKYPDGRPGEIYVELGHAGSSLRASWNLTAMMISIGLQYGVPVEEYVRRLENMKFEPSGFVEGHDQIKAASSIADFIARELGLTFLGRKDMGQIKDEYPERDMNKFDNEINYGRYPKPIQATLDICPACGEPCLVRTGTCQTCTNCAYNDGCGG